MNGVEIVVQAWEESCRALGVPLVPAAPLLRPDPSVLLVNAGVTPFKPAMLRGERLQPTAVVQPCVRTYWGAPGRFAFDMLTMVGMAEDAEIAARLAASLAERLDLARCRLGCVLDERDADVAAHAQILCERDRIEVQEGNNDRYWTRWHFGEGDALVGRGLTLIHVGDDTRLSLGNLIVVDHRDSGQSYVDLGFGVERLASIPHAGDEWAPTPAAAAIARLVARGVRRNYACDLANRAAAAERMIGAGALPDARGAGYLLRKLIRGTVDASVTATAGDAAPELAVERLLADLSVLLDDNISVCAIFGAEAANYLEQVARGQLALLRRHRRTGASLASLDPAGTYGLPTWASARLAFEKVQ